MIVGDAASVRSLWSGSCQLPLQPKNLARDRQIKKLIKLLGVFEIHDEPL